MAIVFFVLWMSKLREHDWSINMTLLSTYNRNIRYHKRTQVRIYPTTLKPNEMQHKMSQRKRKERIFFESSSSVSLYYWQTKEALKEWIVSSQRICFKSKNNHLRMLKVGLIYLYALKFSIFTWDDRC